MISPARRLALLLANAVVACNEPVAGDTTTTTTTDSASSTDRPATTAPPTTSTSDGDTSTSTTAQEPTSTGALSITSGPDTTGTSISTGPETTAPSSSSSDTSAAGSTGASDGCGVHQGDLIITDATDLDSLACIVEVTGSLKILKTQSLTSFAQLANLKVVGDDVDIGENAALIDLDGLSGLVTAKGGDSFGEITIYYNPSLVDITGLHSLAVIDSLVILGNDALADLTGPQGPIVGKLKKGWNFALSGNDALESLDSLAALENFSDKLFLTENSKLADISMLELIVDPTAEFDLYIVDNPALLDLVGLDLITHAREVQVRNNALLKNMVGLGGLESVSLNLYIMDNPGLMDLTGLEALTDARIFRIENNPSLLALTGLDSLKTISQALQIGNCTTAGNAALTDLHGLEQLETVKGLAVSSNAALTSLDGLDSLGSLGGLWVQFNPKLPPAGASALAAKFKTQGLICNNADPPGPCLCPDWMD